MIALLMAGGLSLAVSLVGTRYLIVWLTSHRIGQHIREEGPEGHQVKAGTPTMGGIAIVIGAVVGYSVAHLRSRVVFTRSGMFVLALVVGAGIVGFLDDWLGITRERNLGLTKRTKVLGLLLVAGSFAVATVVWTGVHTQLSFTRYNSFDSSALLNIDFGKVGWAIVAMIVVVLAIDGLVWKPLTAWAEKFRITQSESSMQRTSLVLTIIRQSHIDDWLGMLLRPVGDLLDRVMRPLGRTGSTRAPKARSLPSTSRSACSGAPRVRRRPLRPRACPPRKTASRRWR